MRSLPLILTGILLCGAGPAFAGLTPESVLLIVNGDSPSSLAVANEYAHLRQIPDSNIVFLTGISNIETLPVEEFRRQILGPVLKAIDERQLRMQIRCVAYSSDFPTAIGVHGDSKGRKLPQLLTPVASINGLTFLYQRVMAKDIQYMDMNINHYARRSGVRSGDTPWTPEERDRFATALARVQQDSRRPSPGAVAVDQPADALHPINDRSMVAALQTLQELCAAHPKAADQLFHMACCLGSFNRDEEAMAMLKASVQAGWFDHRHASRDPDLQALVHRADFKSLVEDMKAIRLEVQPALGFRGEMSWQSNGDPQVESDSPRYLLSTVLGVTAGRGLKTAEVIENLQRSAAADGTAPRGTIYFERNGDVRSTTREWAFASAAEKLREMGIHAVVEEGVLPRKKSDVAGAVVGTADFNWKASGSTILPGAIVEHLTSYGGIMTAGAGQTPLTEFLRHGAAGASGTVTEPFAIQAKFPNPFIQVHYGAGASLAEAFYLSVPGPYQLLIVGDPLCCPWRRNVGVTVESPMNETPWQDSVTLLPKVTLPVGMPLLTLQVFIDGKLAPYLPTKDGIELDLKKLSDGRHTLTLVTVARDLVESVGRWTTQFSVQNSGRKERDAALPVLTRTTTGNHSILKPLKLEVACAGATQIAIEHLGRTVATVSGASGQVSMDARKLGSGPVRLRPVAIIKGTAVAGAAMLVDVQPQ